jgi:hypothetical protein
MASGSSKHLCGDKICNILEENEGKFSSDSGCEAEFVSSDTGSCHVDDTALGKIIASQIDTKGENECKENMGNYIEQREKM